METKILIDYQEYCDLLEISKKYFELKRKGQAKEKEETEEKLDEEKGQTGKGLEEERKADLDSIVQEVINRLSKKNSEAEEIIKAPFTEQEKILNLNKVTLEGLLNKFAKRDAKKAALIINTLFFRPDFCVNDSNEVSIEGILYPGSNIIKLIKCAIRSGRGNLLIAKPQFLSFLGKCGLDSLINVKRKEKKIKPVISETEELVPKADMSKKWYCLA